MEENRTQLVLPVICTRGMVVFPNNDLTLDVGRPKSLKAIEDAANKYDGNLIFVSQVKMLIIMASIMLGLYVKSKRKFVVIALGQ